MKSIKRWDGGFFRTQSENPQLQNNSDRKNRIIEKGPLSVVGSFLGLSPKTWLNLNLLGASSADIEVLGEAAAFISLNILCKLYKITPTKVGSRASFFSFRKSDSGILKHSSPQRKGLGFCNYFPFSGVDAEIR